MKLDFQAVLDSLKSRPDDFDEDGYTLIDRASGVEYWTAGGFFFYSVFFPRLELSLLQQLRFHRALMGWRKEVKRRREDKAIAILNRRLKNGIQTQYEKSTR